MITMTEELNKTEVFDGDEFLHTSDVLLRFKLNSLFLNIAINNKKLHGNFFPRTGGTFR